MAHAQEEKSKGARTSQAEAPPPGEPSELRVEVSDKALPAKMAPNREHVIETTRRILGHIHALHLQTMHEMGSVREVDRTLAQALMAEFVRLQLIISEDLTRSLLALCADLEASCETLGSDIVRAMDLHPHDPMSRQVKATLQRFQQITSLKVALPLMELEAACEDMKAFMWGCLQELSSQTESWELIGEFSQRLADHVSRVQELIQDLELIKGEVSQLVLVGLGAHQPLEANFFPGILEGLVGRLGLAPLGIMDPPTPVREGMAYHWVAALRETIRRTEGRDINLRPAASTIVPHGLHLDYDLDF